MIYKSDTSFLFQYKRKRFKRKIDDFRIDVYSRKVEEWYRIDWKEEFNVFLILDWNFANFMYFS